MAANASISTMRVAGRLANAFILDLIKLGDHGRDVIDALLRAAVLNSNLAHLSGDLGFQRRYATADGDPPDEMRRPASINAIATSLQLPFETVRRRLAGLAETGVCTITPAGVIVPQAATSSPRYRAALRTQYDGLETLYRRLRSIQALEPPANLEPWGADLPVRLVGRHVIAYVLRFAELTLEHVGDPFTTLTLLQIVRANTEGLADEDGGGVGAEPSAFVPDARRTPATVAQLAHALRVSDETIRRHVGRLQEAGLCRKADRGYIIPAEALARSEVVAFALHNLVNLNRLFATLGEFGVTRAWEPAAGEIASVVSAE